jgi:hypothetical protein
MSVLVSRAFNILRALLCAKIYQFVVSGRRSQSIQNLYSTVNGLLASADRLSQQVAQQMEALNISSQPQIAQKILKSVGMSSEDTLHVLLFGSNQFTLHL